MGESVTHNLVAVPACRQAGLGIFRDPSMRRESSKLISRRRSKWFRAGPRGFACWQNIAPGFDSRRKVHWHFSPAVSRFALVGPAGIEPTLHDPQPCVLPLYYGPIYAAEYTIQSAGDTATHRLRLFMSDLDLYFRRKL